MEAKQIRAYIREGITQIPLEAQRHACQEVADNLGLRVQWYVGVDKDVADERDLWAQQLRETEIGLIYSLPVLRLAARHIKHKDPKAEFAGFMHSLSGMYLMEADGGLTSDKRAKWRSKVTEVAHKRPPGTNGMTTERASKIASDGWETRDKGTVALWQSKARTKQRAHLAKHRKLSGSARAAHEGIADFAESMDGGVYNELIGISVSSMNRILDPKLK